MSWLQRLVPGLALVARWILIIVSPIWSPLPLILRKRKWLWLQHLHRLLPPVVLARAEARLHPADANILHHYRLRLAEIKGVAEWAEQLQQAQYDATHASQFTALWKALKPEVPAPPIPSSAWGEIGFQGKDPATDLRGGGLAGLAFLVFFAETFPDAARHSLLQASHPKYWFPFACAGINVAVFIMKDLLGKPESAAPRLLTPHFLLHGCTPEQLRVVFCHLLVQLCDAYIAAEPENIMAFPAVLAAFQQRVRTQLLTTGVLFSHINETHLAPRHPLTQA